MSRLAVLVAALLLLGLTPGLQTAQDAPEALANPVVAATPVSAFSVAPTASGGVGSALVGGWATYYATCPDCAAAGPLLREALGPTWRGHLVEVQSDHGSVTLRLTDFCACGERKGKPTFIDVSMEAFNELSPYPVGSSKDPGVIPVWIELDPPEHEADRRMRLEDQRLPETDAL